MSEGWSHRVSPSRRNLLSLTALMLAGYAGAQAKLMPTLADAYVLLDVPPDPAKTAALSNIVDQRSLKTDNRVVTSTAVVLGDKDFHTGPIESIQTEMYEYALTQWRSSEVLKTLASQPIQVREFLLSYSVDPDKPQPVDLSLGPAVAAFDMLVRSAMGQVGDFRLRLTLAVGERVFPTSEVARFGANSGVVPSYASRSLFKKCVHRAAAQIVAHMKGVG